MDRVRVLVVDDHFLFAQSIASVIRELPPFELTGIAVTGPQTLAMVHEERPDIVLLDFHLPGYSGDTLIPRIAQVSPSTRVLVLTSDTSQAAMTRAMAAGAAGFMTKDKAIDDVVDELRRIAGLGAETAPPARPAPPVPPPSVADVIAAAPRRPPAEPIEVRIAGIHAFAEAVLIERFIDRLAGTEHVYIRDLDADGASLRVGLGGSGTADALARELLEGSQRLRLTRRDANVLQLQAEAPLIDG